MKKVLVSLFFFTVLTGCFSKKAMNDEIKNNCSDYEIIDSINFGGGEGDVTGTLKYGICNGKDEFYAVSKGVLNTSYTYEDANVVKYKNAFYRVHNNVITIIASDDFSNYKSLLVDGNVLKYDNVHFYQLRNITDSRIKLLLYQSVSIDDALYSEYKDVEFIKCLKNLSKYYIESKNINIDSYIASELNSCKLS